MMSKPSFVSENLLQFVKQVHTSKGFIDEALDYYIERTKKISPKINSHIFFNEEYIHSQKKELKQRLSKGETPSLAGIPVLVKDNIAVSDIPMTCASSILKNYIPSYDATVVKRLKDNGAIILGKTNLDEFAMGSSNEFSCYGPVKNPWDLNKVSGGSSGGSAAAVACDLAPIALGSDTGGSVRQPASFCGVVGLKPSYGSLSRFGLTAFASSLDQVGLFAKKAEDISFVLTYLCAHDPKDSTSNTLASFEAAYKPQEKMKVGVVEEFFKGASKDVLNALESAKKTFLHAGVEFEDVSIKETRYTIPVYYILATAEASSNLSRYDGMRYGLRVDTPESDLENVYAQTRFEGFGEEVIRRIVLGTFVLSEGYSNEFYLKAKKARSGLTMAFDKVFSRFDALLGPTVPHTAFAIGEKKQDPISMYTSDICTVSANLVGGCAISVPCGFDSSQLPIGLQLMGNKTCEHKILALAKKYQEITSWHKNDNQEV